MARDVVLWLWKIHNRANVHLHGDATEDPRHPKIQFPSYEACPACRITSAATARFNLTDDMWIESNVLTYLLRFYGQSSIVDDDIEGFSAATNGGKEYSGLVQPVSMACLWHLNCLLLAACLL